MNGTRTAVETPGETLGRLIQARWMKKARLARAIGTSAERLNRIITGTSELTAVEAARLAEIFGVPIETFVPKPDAPPDVAKVEAALLEGETMPWGGGA